MKQVIDIKTLQNHFANDLVFITQHAVERCRQRKIKMKDIKEVLMNGTIIEQYPQDFPFPSCLIFGYSMEKVPIHIVMSEEGNASRIITAYIPTLERWEPDYKKRKGQ